MLNEDKLSHYGDLMSEREKEEPVLSLWRIQRDGGKRLGFASKLKSAIRPFIDRGRAVGKPEYPMNGQLVFYASFNTPTTWGALQPVVEETVHRGAVPFVLTNSYTDGVTRKSSSVAKSDFRSWIAQLSTPLRKRLKSKAKDLASEVADHFGVDYDEDLPAHLELAFLMEAAAYEHLCGARAVIIETDYFPVAKGLALGANRLNIPVITLQHGLFGRHQFPMYCSKHFLWGKYFIGQAGKFGLGVERSLVSGCPRWDILQKYEGMPRDSAIRTLLGGVEDKPLILLLSNTQAARVHSDIYREYLRSVRILLEKGCSTVVKLHPAEKDLSVYKQEIPDRLLQKLKIVPASISLYDALRHADVVYHVFSAGALEAMILNVPVLFTSAVETKRLTDMPEMGGGAWCGESDVADFCDGFGTQGERRTEILRSQHSFLDDAVEFRGYATARSMDLIEECTRS